MNCSKCNSELKEGAKFCGKCGTPQVALPVDSTQAAVTQTSAPSNVQVSKSEGSETAFLSNSKPI